MALVVKTDGQFEEVTTRDGSPTLIHPGFGEAYGSVDGAVTQARELYLKRTGTDLHPGPKVLEVGFGLGANFRVTLEHALARGVRLDYLAYEGYPVGRDVLEGIGPGLEGAALAVWEEVVSRWPGDGLTLEGEWGRLRLRFADVRQACFPEGWATAIYLDPFSPKVNPEPWQWDVLARLFAATQPGGRLATYSVAGRVRRGLAAAGFAVRKVLGFRRKHWTLAEKPLSPAGPPDPALQP